MTIAINKYANTKVKSDHIFDLLSAIGYPTIAYPHAKYNNISEIYNDWEIYECNFNIYDFILGNIILQYKEPDELSDAFYRFKILSFKETIKVLYKYLTL